MSEKGTYKRAYLLSDEEFSLITSALRGTRLIRLCAELAVNLEQQRDDSPALAERRDGKWFDGERDE